MEAVLALALLTGLDNLRFGIGLGTLDIPTEQRFRLAAAFGLFEAGTPIIAPADGVVSRGGRFPQLGNSVDLAHGRGDFA